MSRYNVNNIYNEVTNQLEYYHQDGANRILELVIDDFNDWVWGYNDLTKLALRAIYDFAIEKEILIPTMLKYQMMDYNIIKV